MAQRVDGHHQAPAQGPDRAQEALRLASERHQRREEQEHPHGDEHDEHVVPVDRRFPPITVSPWI